MIQQLLLGPEFRQSLVKKIIKDFWRKKLFYAKIVLKLGDLTVLFFSDSCIVFSCHLNWGARLDSFYPL